MSEPDFAALAQAHTLRGLEVPRIARELADGTEPELVWRNDLDGLTFRVGERYLKWNPGFDRYRPRT